MTASHKYTDGNYRFQYHKGKSNEADLYLTLLLHVANDKLASELSQSDSMAQQTPQCN